MAKNSNLAAVPTADVDVGSPEALDYLPRGWQKAILDLAARGRWHGAFIKALGIAPQDFYLLSRKNALFAEVLSIAHAHALEWFENKLCAIIDGHGDAKTQKALEMVFNARFSNFEKRYTPAAVGEYQGDLNELLLTMDLNTLLSAVEKRGFLTRISTRAACGGGDSVIDLARGWQKYFEIIVKRLEKGELDNATALDKLEGGAMGAGFEFKNGEGWDKNKIPTELSTECLARVDKKIKQKIAADEAWVTNAEPSVPPNAVPPNAVETAGEECAEPELTFQQKLARAGRL